jgi:hypothetical protein
VSNNKVLASRTKLGCEAAAFALDLGKKAATLERDFDSSK